MLIYLDYCILGTPLKCVPPLALRPALREKNTLLIALYRDPGLQTTFPDPGFISCLK